MPTVDSVSDIQLSARDFEFLRERIHACAGIWMADVKRDLIQSRIRPRLLQLKYSGFAQYVRHLKELPPGDPEWQTFINLLTTNKTDWFRENAHFEYLRKDFLPKWLSTKKNKLNVWCAASSTGEEPYTLSLVLNRELTPQNKTYHITASDIDTDVLLKARNGVYPRAMIEQIPEPYRDGFAMGQGEISSWMKVRSHIRQSIRFERINLVETPYPAAEPYDLIFCRNVLIYFDRARTEAVAKGLEAAAAPDAVLVIAHSESIQNLSTPWKYQQPSVYSKGKAYR